MTIVTKTQNAFKKLIDRAGRIISIKNWQIIYDQVYDESAKLILSGTTWTSGIVLPMDNEDGSKEGLLTEDGFGGDHYQRLFLSGNTITTSDEYKLEIVIGSPSGDSYTVVPNGIIQVETNGENIYQKIYIQKLSGSLI
jgi:hypothetical protein